jgi:alpha-N-arabinofuranosidase
MVFCVAGVFGQNTLSLNLGQATYTIKKEVYGALFENWGRDIYTGLYVGEASSIPNTSGMRNDVIAALIDAGVSCLDWPGGCFAETYLWTDGIGTKASRPSGEMVNGLGTNEYFQLCNLMGIPPYITANITSTGTAVMTSWLNYINTTFPGQLKYWKMGNEIWGGCGTVHTASYYTGRYDLYKVAIPSAFSGNLFRIADGGSGNGSTVAWFPWLDTVMLREMGSMEGVTFHYYAGLNNSGPSYGFTEAQYYSRLQLAYAMYRKIDSCELTMNVRDPNYTVGLMVDEWGAWYTGISGMGSCYQQNTCRDAVIAAMHLNLFNNHCRRVKMACVAQVINVIQSLILTRTTDAQFIKTPTFYVFKMFKVHQNATMVPAALTCGTNQSIPLITASASVDSSNVLHISLCNTHATTSQSLSITLNNSPRTYSTCTGTIVNGAAFGTYNDYGVENVNIQTFAPSNFNLSGTTLTVSTLPAHSVVTLALTPTVGVLTPVNRSTGELFSISTMTGGRIVVNYTATRKTPVNLSLYGVDGRTIVESFSGTLEPGEKSLVWQPKYRIMGTGAYVVKMTAGEVTKTQRVVLAR